ncbi:MAG: DinB family protein [Gemmatimonadetes bacterium]|nr:DinB family protein [Gemmatimonadota bacterium]MCC7132223.1 DinB family protein [Gemmatimonadales bacterium]
MRAVPMVLFGALLTAPAAAQPSADPATLVKAGFSEVSEWITKAADLVPADKWSYRPVATVRTFGQMVAHVADSYTFYCARAAGKKVEWADPIEKGPTDKATVSGKLAQATAQCNAVYATGALPPLMANIGHSNLHYGNLITYIRMMGLTPPSS